MVVLCEACETEESQYDLDQLILEKFMVPVCSSCARSHPELYSLVPKTTAKSEFLLTEEELADTAVLPHFSKPNPKSPRWSNMQLYLRKHLLFFSNNKWGGPEQLEAEKERKSLRSTTFKVRRFENKVKDLRKKTRLENSLKKFRPTSANRHEHAFVPIAAEEGIKKCTLCGLEIKYETI